MNARVWDYGYIIVTVAMTVYGQLILKWRLADTGVMPEDFVPKVRYLVALCFDPYIFSGLAAAFIASLAWMAALTRFELNYAYPFTSLSFVLVLLLSAWLLHEAITVERLVGVALIVAGTLVASRG